MNSTSLFLPPLSNSGEVITFYSYNGGTGCSMALSNIATLLARRQNATAPVLMIDWDLEAPGLHRYFDHHHEHKPGVLEFFEACREQLLRRPLGMVSAGDDELAHEVLSAVGWEQYVSRVDDGSQLYLMRAGRFDDSYAERVADLRWEELFNICPALYRCFAERLARHFRHVLVDTRSGRTDSAGICTTLLPRKLVLVFSPDRHGLGAVQALVERATTYRRSHEDEQRPLLIYPLPSRIEMDDGVQRARWRRGDEGYQASFEDLMRDCYGMQQVSLESYFNEVQLQQTRQAIDGELVAVRQEREGDRFSLTRTFEALLAWLAPGYFPWQSSGEIRLTATVQDARKALEEGGVAARLAWQPLARDLHLLGELYQREGKLRQALASFEESLTLRVRGLGEDHPHTLGTKANLADALRQQGRLDEAQFLEECIVESRARILGGEHLDTLAARASLASTLSEQGRVAEALALQDGVLDTYSRLLGAEHCLTLAGKAARAELLLQRGDVEHARSAHEQVLAARKRVLGSEHPDTLRSRTGLARTLIRMQELEAAGSLLDAVQQVQLRRLGVDHPDTRAVCDLLAEVQLQLGLPCAEGTLVREVQQDAAMDDYGDALSVPARRRSGQAWSRANEEFLALEGHLGSARGAPR